MLWIALYLPALPLQVSHRGLLPDLPLVISDGALQRPVVLEANEAARSCGIAPGMLLADAQALAEHLTVQPRDSGREQAALHALAAWASQFTPVVVLEADGILLEVQPSLRLFGGLAQLGKRVQQEAGKLGFDIALSAAPTPLAASLLSRARAADPAMRGCRHLSELPAKLDPLPLALFGWPQQVMQAMTRLGITTIGHCRRLPRDGLIRRFGMQIVDELDRAYGERPDPRKTFEAPKIFFSSLELAAENDNVEWLKQPVRLLLAELEGYLLARRQAAAQLLLRFDHGQQNQTALPVNFSEPQCRADEFMALVVQHMVRMVLPAPVRAISLQVEQLQAHVAVSHSLVPDAAQQRLAWQQLNERLAARLPAGMPYRLAVQDDHRPEHGWLRNGEAAQPLALPDLPRPAWLLMPPRGLGAGEPYYEGRLTMLTTGERIEAGWWDGNPMGRDYYIARNPKGLLCWIYQDHQNRQWYLHGLFG